METKEFNRMIYGTFNEPTTWQPTPDEIRECCGVWVNPIGKLYNINVDFLIQVCENPTNTIGRTIVDKFRSYKSSLKLKKIETIPEQCIPKPDVPEERYLVRYPLLAGIF